MEILLEKFVGFSPFMSWTVLLTSPVGKNKMKQPHILNRICFPLSNFVFPLTDHQIGNDLMSTKTAYI